MEIPTKSSSSTPRKPITLTPAEALYLRQLRDQQRDAACAVLTFVKWLELSKGVSLANTTFDEINTLIPNENLTTKFPHTS